MSFPLIIGTILGDGYPQAFIKLTDSVPRDPKSRSMACLTERLVVRGPGVKRALSFREDNELMVEGLNGQILS
jgi:hypothetical protein